MRHVAAPTALRVYVYAQTLIVDQSVDFEVSMYIRARQIIINYDVDPFIGFNENGEALPYDIDQAVTRGKNN